MYHGTPAERAEMRRTVMRKGGEDEEQKEEKEKDEEDDSEDESTQGSPAKKSKAKTTVEVDEDENEDGEEANNKGKVEGDKTDSYHSSFPVILTTYEILMRDRPHLARHHWGYIVVDEGHRLKNFDCRLMREIKQLNSGGRLILSGTPLHVSISFRFCP
jgi:ATP-dependent DNA helicase